MITHTIILNLGALEIFTKHDVIPGEFTKNFPGFYWSDSRHNLTAGPFTNVHETSDNYAKAMRNIKLKYKKLCEVVTVDFTLKQRII